MAEYEVREEKRAAIESKIDEWLRLEDIQHLEVCRKRGNAHSKIADSEIDAEELEALGTGEAVLDRVLDQIAGLSGRMELRLRFKGYSKEGGRGDLHKAFQMVRAREPSTKSQGSNAATEQLATSLASAFDQQAARVESRDTRQAEFLTSVMARQDESAERRLSEHSSYQIEIMRLQTELTESRMQIAFMEAQAPIPPEVWAEVLRAAVPVVGDLVGTLKSAVTAWGANQTALADPAAAPAAAPAEPQPAKAAAAES